MTKLLFFLMLMRGCFAKLVSSYSFFSFSSVPTTLFGQKAVFCWRAKGILFSQTPSLSNVGRVILSFLAGMCLLVLFACSGGGGGGSPSGGSSNPFKVSLAFTPTVGGFNIEITDDSGLSDFDYLNITAIDQATMTTTEDSGSVTKFVNNGFLFDGLTDGSYYKFSVEGNFTNNGTWHPFDIVFDDEQDQNEEDHKGSGIRTGANKDGDGRADSVDEDIDGDGVCDKDGGDCDDARDLCPTGETGWESDKSTDHDGDGCRDRDEDPDDDNDGIMDGIDQCPAGERGWMSNPSSDYDDDGCQDDGEDTDDDNDGLEDIIDVSLGCNRNPDCDGDGAKDGDEAARNCITDPDCDKDGLRDGAEASSCTQTKQCDGDTIPDNEDVDMDGDGLIEIATAAQLNAVRYALNGSGRQLSEGGSLNMTGCGGDSGITSCSGYELVADISLTDYRDDDGGKGWQPLGHDDGTDDRNCGGDRFSETFQGNGFVISDLAINRSTQDCVGLFGQVAFGAEIVNLTLQAEEVIGNNNVGALVGFDGVTTSSGQQGVRIVSTLIEAAQVSGRDAVGGFVGNGPNVRIVSSSVVAGQIGGNINTGGLVGWSTIGRVVSSSVVAGLVAGDTNVGGLMGHGNMARIVSSSVVAGQLRGEANIGGLVGDGASARIVSSSVVAGQVRGTVDNIGGLVGDGTNAQIVSSSVVAGEVRGGSSRTGGSLAADFQSGEVAYSYAVVGNVVNMLTESESGINNYSYWDSATSGVKDGSGWDHLGDPKTTDELREPTGYTGIYETWDDGVDIDNTDGDNNLNTGIDNITIYCDEDASDDIEEGEAHNDNRIWDFGTSMQYPAIHCLPISPDEWRSWWFLNSTTHKPELDQPRLDAVLP